VLSEAHLTARLTGHSVPPLAFSQPSPTAKCLEVYRRTPDLRCVTAHPETGDPDKMWRLSPAAALLRRSLAATARLSVPVLPFSALPIFCDFSKRNSAAVLG
jgi:hypothetical protein